MGSENKEAFRKESHAHRGRCAGSRTARDIAQPLSAEFFFSDEVIYDEIIGEY